MRSYEITKPKVKGGVGVAKPKVRGGHGVAESKVRVPGVIWGRPGWKTGKDKNMYVFHLSGFAPASPEPPRPQKSGKSRKTIL